MSKPLVLIVEDDPHLSHIFAIALDNDFETEIAGDGRKALNRLAQVTPALVVLDLHLPEVGGAEILAHIRAEGRLEQTPVILTTADSIQANALDALADIILLKPVSPIQLRRLATRLVLEAGRGPSTD